MIEEVASHSRAPHKGRDRKRRERRDFIGYDLPALFVGLCI